jgi:hypothetical protein
MVHHLAVWSFVARRIPGEHPQSTGIAHHDQIFDKRLGTWHHHAFFFSESMIPSTMHLFRHPDAINSAPSRCI